MNFIPLVRTSLHPELVIKFFNEKEQDSLLRHIFRQALFVSPCVFLALPFINIYDSSSRIYDRRCKMLKIPIALAIVGVTASALGCLKRRQKTIESHGKLNSKDKSRIEANRFLRNFIWKTICSHTIQVLIHELGHYFAALALFNISPTIDIFLDGSGITTLGKGLFINKKNLMENRSTLGKKFSVETIYAIVSSAGPAFQILHSCAELFSAFLLKKSYPEASGVLKSLAIQNIIRLCGYSLMDFGIITNPNILYALAIGKFVLPLFSLMIAPETGDMISDIYVFACYILPKTGGRRDFSILYEYGFHPLRCLSVLVAIPLTFQLSLVVYDYFSSKNYNGAHEA